MVLPAGVLDDRVRLTEADLLAELDVLQGQSAALTRSILGGAAATG